MPRVKMIKVTTEACAAVLFLLPSLVGVVIFALIPFTDTIRRSFFNAMGTDFKGFSNYISVLQNDAFHLAVANTAKFICICVPILLSVSLALALTLRAVRPYGKIFKTTFLLPMAIPVASIVLLWQVLFNENGLVNSVLLAFGLQNVDFIGSSAAFWVLIITYVWKNSGYDMILWLCGLDSISDNLYEAASVDGANAWQKFRFVTMPSLLPTLTLATVLSLLNTFKVFREAYLVAGSYPNESIYMLQHLFNNWFRELDLGRLTASAVLTALALLGFILFLSRFWKGAEE